MNNFNICEILGVDIDEPFIFRNVRYKINDYGFIQSADSDFAYAGMPAVCNMINNPQEIEKLIRFNDGEKYILKILGVRYVTRDIHNGLEVCFWRNKPKINNNGIYSSDCTIHPSSLICTIPAELFPHVKKGQLIKVTEELLND